jgi:hypothetical protein
MIQRKAKSKKKTQTYQNYRLLRWEGNVTVVARQFMNLKNTMTRIKKRRMAYQ